MRKHLQPAGTSGGDPSLNVAERDDEEPRTALESAEPCRVCVRLVDRLGACVRPPAEVDELAAQATLHRPVRGDGRVDPTGEKRERPAADPHRKASPAGDLLRVREDLALVDLEEDLEVGVHEVDVECELVLYGAADNGGEPPGIEREALVAAAWPYGEGSARPVLQKLDRAGASRLHGLLEHERGMEQARAENVAAALEQLVGRCRSENCEHPSTLAELERAEVVEEADDVAAKLRVEEGAVASLEDDLAELDQDARLHRLEL